MLKAINLRSCDVLNLSSPHASRMQEAHAKLEKAQFDLTNEAKYTSREELDGSGLRKKYDELQRTLINLESQSTISKIAHSRLNNEKIALEKINKIMLQFKADAASQAKISGSMQTRVDNTLKELETAFRAKDTAGKYVWGGRDATIDPLSKIDIHGNRISTSLVNESNIDNGLITNNYSSSAADDRIITVSSEHEVRESFIHPSHDAIAKAIGFLNMIKENANAKDAGAQAVYSDAEILAAENDDVQTRGALRAEIDTEHKKIEEAFDINKRDIQVAVKENGELFSADIIERSQKVKDLLVSFSALITTSNIFTKMSDKLSELRV